jgi:hypothetical protein
MRIICDMRWPTIAMDVQSNSHRRVRAASDGAGLSRARRVAVAGDRFPPGDPRRLSSPHQRSVQARVMLRGSQA